MSRRAEVLWGLFWSIVGGCWLDVVGTVCLDARGGIGGSAVEQTFGAILFCAPGILFASVGVILLIRAAGNHKPGIHLRD